MKKYLLVLGALSASYQLIAADIGAGKIEFEKIVKHKKRW